MGEKISRLINMDKSFFRTKLFGRLLIYILITHLYLILSIAPLLIQVSKTPPGTYFPLYHTENQGDYDVYLSVITQGENGNWLMKDSFTSEMTNPTVFYFYYILVGKIANLFSLAPQIAYHLARLISVEFYFMALYFLNRYLLGEESGFWSSVIAIVATISPLPLFHEPFAFKTYSPWWYEIEALKRIDLMPHYLFSYALMFIFTVFIFKYLSVNRKKYLYLALPIIFASGIFLPTSLLPLLFCFPLAYLVTLIRNFILTKKISINIKIIRQMTPFYLIAILTLLIILRENYNGFPWDIWNKWEITKWNFGESRFNYALFISFGILPILALPAIIRILRLGNLKRLFLVFWGIFPFLFLPFVSILGFSKMRLVSIAPFIPLSYLASVSIFEIFGSKKIIRNILLSCIFIFSVPVTIQILTNTITATMSAPTYQNTYTPDEYWQAIYYLKNNTPKGSIVLSDDYMGNIIPAYSMTVSYFGHPVHTRDFYAKQENVRLFLSQKLDTESAYKFLKTNNIKYVYYSPDERMFSTSPIFYPFLKPVYQNRSVTVYRID